MNISILIVVAFVLLCFAITIIYILPYLLPHILKARRMWKDRDKELEGGSNANR